MDIAWGQKEENLISTAEKLRHVHHDTDVVVLPETFTTGFVRKREQLRELAETNDGHTMDDVHRWAKFFKFAIVGSFVACDKSRTTFYNRAFSLSRRAMRHFMTSIICSYRAARARHTQPGGNSLP